MHILVTGFEPFGQDTSNASADILTRLPEILGAHRISTALLPVSFDRAGSVLMRAVAQRQPDALVCLGEAGGRHAITPELWGYNQDRARIADNDGQQPHDATIIPGAPPRVPATLSPEPILHALLSAGFRAELSQDPGRFLCNHVAFRAYTSPIPAIFIHVPAVREDGQPARVGAETDGGSPVATDIDLSQLTQAIEVCLGTL